MGFNFPATPSIGQKYPEPAIVGKPVYIYDGEKWLSVGSGSTTNVASVTTSTTPPPNPKDGDLWFDEISGVLFVFYVDANSSQWVAAASGTTAPGAVRYDGAQALTSAQAVQARKNVFASPFDAMAYHGLQVNGSMEFSQQFGSTPQTTPGAYIADQWTFQKSSTAVVNGGQYALSTPWFPGFPNCLIAVTTNGAAMAANDFVYLSQNIEGNRLARLQWGTANAQPITIAFWSQHSLPGTYSAAVRNAANNRSHVITYTQNVADAAEYKVVTIPGDTAGTWPKDNGPGMGISFVAASGATYTAPAANTWYGINYIAAPGQVNACAAAPSYFRITGVIVLPGTEAPSAARAPFITRPYDQELLQCRRYLVRRNFTGTAIATLQTFNATLGGGHLFGLHPQMRAVPTILTSALSTFGLYTPGGGATTVVSLAFGATVDDVWLGTSTFTSSSTIPAGAAQFIGNAGAWIQADARL